MMELSKASVLMGEAHILEIVKPNFEPVRWYQMKRLIRNICVLVLFSMIPEPWVLIDD
jgi:hypothetical protein